MNQAQKHEALRKNIASRRSMLVAFSGGVDSSLLAVLAREVLGDKTRCVLLDSPVVPRTAIADAERIAMDRGLSLEIVPVRLMNDEQFVKNPPDRCYHCKKNAAKILKEKADEQGLACVADGANASDIGEHRPGIAADDEEGICHPFIETGITKHDIRTIARKCGLDVWQKPQSACLASRIPYGDEITEEKLSMIEEAEEFLHDKGFGQVRVRIDRNSARIEVIKVDMQKLLSIHRDVVKKLKSIGFSYIAVDLEGYRSGSMDEVL
jgi:uncharacterized protein